MRKFSAFAPLSLAFAALLLSTACEWDPAAPFERYAPQVDLSIALMDGGDAKAPADLLADYLTTGVCDDGTIGSPPRVREKPRAAFDLGLALFRVSELYGRRFGEEELPEVPGKAEGSAKLRELQAKCATAIATVVAKDSASPWDLRSRAYYLLGNLSFLQKNYTEAVESYDEALRFAPAQEGDAGAGTIGKDAAWNRAIALRRRDDPKDGGPDAEPDASQDASSDAKPEGGDGGGDAASDANGADSGKDGGGDGGGQGAPDGGDRKDGGDNKQEDAGTPPPNQGDAGAPPPPQNQGASLDERMLDELERIPNMQKESAKILKKRHKPSTMEDK